MPTKTTTSSTRPRIEVGKGGLTRAARRRQERKIKQRRDRLGAPSLHEREVTSKDFTRKPARTDLPMHWPGAAKYSADTDDFDQATLVQIAKQCGLLDELRAETASYGLGGGRPRTEGEWCLAAMCWVNSGKPDIQPWLRDTDAMMWWEAGFTKRPKYHTVRNRFLELEALAIDAFFRASGNLIRYAIEITGGRAAFDLHFDCTEAETNARLHHDCEEGEGCPG
jgi:hypothetical protein